MRTKILLAVFALVAVASEGQVQAGLTKLYEFPESRELIQDLNGALTLSGTTFYGTANLGGTKRVGSLYRIEADGTGFQFLHSFDPTEGGFHPESGVVVDGTVIYGTAPSKGAGKGSIYRINTDGTGFQTIRSFTGGSDDGAVPVGGMTLVGGKLFGTTMNGGPTNRGTVFSMNTDGSDFTILHKFQGGTEEGALPFATLISDGSTLYGTTAIGGAIDGGTVFSIRTDGSDFRSLASLAGRAINSYPYSSPLLLHDSTLYGVTYPRPGHLGQIYRLDVSGSDYSVLHEFPSEPPSYMQPTSGLSMVGTKLYGAMAPWQFNFVAPGSLYEMNLDGTDFKITHEFENLGRPVGNLTVVGSKLYGTTSSLSQDILFSYVVPEPSGTVLLVGGVLSLSLFSFLSNRRRLSGVRGR